MRGDAGSFNYQSQPVEVFGHGARRGFGMRKKSVFTGTPWVWVGRGNAAIIARNSAFCDLTRNGYVMRKVYGRAESQKYRESRILRKNRNIPVRQKYANSNDIQLRKILLSAIHFAVDTDEIRRLRLRRKCWDVYNAARKR